MDIDTTNERMQKKIRDAQLQKIPYMLVVGEREAENGTVAVRLRSGKDLGAMTLDKFLARIKQAGEFGVNVLSHAQDDLARNFAVTKADKFSGADWFTDDGLPRLAGVAGWMACELNHAVEGGDHLLLFGLVRAASSRRDLPPLVYAHKTYGTHSRFAQRPRPAIADLIAACAR